jgi:hypothetical protein
MRAFRIAADVVMGLILGLFLYAVVVRLWPGLQGPVAAGAILAAGVVVVLFRRPGGSLTRPSRDQGQ